MKSRLLTLLVIAVLAALTGCDNSDNPPTTPVFLGLPDSARKDTTVMVKLYSEAPTGKFLSYVIEWGASDIETSATYVAGDTAEQWHTWHEVGTFICRAMVYYTFDSTKFSDWSAGKTLVVHP